ncbi:cyclic nucleotide-binding domain protein [gamma proteobacterium HTCC5015]|nr:cyclic nucleotide-binding domain protein [gamma proteobacterium HTCC5015]
MGNTVTSKQLLKLVPLEGINPENLQELASKAEILRLGLGKMVFKRGDQEKKHIYVLEGTVELIDELNRSMDRISAEDAKAKHPIDPPLPRRYSCRVIEPATILSIDSNLLDIMLTWDQTGTYQVEETQEGEDGQEEWMNQILQCKAFHSIPPTNIQAMFMCMEHVDVMPGDEVIKQGEEGDYFYVIKKGRALVTRATEKNPKGIKLAELQAGDSFGEEALISDNKRNATITMLKKGSLARLSKNNFIELLNEPMQNWLELSEAQPLVDSGEATLLDVRLPAEFQQSSIEGSTNLPMIFLRMKHKQLDASKKIIVCCDTGRRSSAAAYILAERGFDTYVLKGGINAALSDA